MLTAINSNLNNVQIVRQQSLHICKMQTFKTINSERNSKKLNCKDLSERRYHEVSLPTGSLHGIAKIFQKFIKRMKSIKYDTIYSI